MICSLFCLPKRCNFDDIDKDKDGFITMNEYNDYIIKQNGTPPTLEQWMRFHLADVRHDGKISKLEFNNILLFF